MQAQVQSAEPYVALPLRSHTILGVCEGIGEDFGISPLFIRVPLAAMVLWSPMIASAFISASERLCWLRACSSRAPRLPRHRSRSSRPPATRIASSFLSRPNPLPQARSTLPAHSCAPPGVFEIIEFSEVAEKSPGL